MHGARATRLTELQPAVRARALDERRRRATRRTWRFVARGRPSADLESSKAFALERRTPVAGEQSAELGNVSLLDQEVCASASTFAGARRAADDRWNAGGQTTISE